MIGRILDIMTLQPLSKRSQSGSSTDVILLRYRECLLNQCDCVDQTLQGASMLLSGAIRQSKPLIDQVWPALHLVKALERKHLSHHMD
jgi:hypothetical protein